MSPIPHTLYMRAGAALADRISLIHNGSMLETDKDHTGSNDALAHEADVGRYTPDYLEARTVEALVRWTDQGSHFAAQYGKKPSRPPKLVFDLRGMNAGEFVAGGRRYDGPCIRINRELLHRYPEHMIQQVVPHEIAHYVVWVMYRRRARPHGDEWRAVMRHFGKPADVSHRMAVTPARRVRKLPFVCGCHATQRYSAVILKRHLAGTRYYCRRCKQRLLPAPVVANSG